MAGLFDVMQDLRGGGSISLPTTDDFNAIAITVRARELEQQARDMIDEKFHTATLKAIESENA
jgi:hypothetical protein